MNDLSPAERKARWDEFDKKMINEITEHGWSDVAVFPTTDAPGLPFNYSVGLSQSYLHPELIVMGLSPEQMHGVLWSVVHEIADGVRFEPNVYYDTVLKGLRVAFVAVDDPINDDFPMSTTRHLMGDDFTALQLVWPDERDRFPWHDDCDPTFSGRQVLLGSWTEPADG